MMSLAELLPQAAPMILLSGYEEPTEEKVAEAFVDVDEKAPFFEPELDGVPSCVALEYMAQTMALLTGFFRRRRGLGPRVGFVLGSRKLTVSVPCFRRGERYRVRAECVYQDEEFGSFDCEIRDPSGAVVASGSVTAFQPGDDLTEEKLKEYM